VIECCRRMLVSCWCGGDLREMSRHHLLRTHRPDFCTTSTKKTSASTNQISSHYSSFITFRVSRRRREMYCVHARLSICVSVCVSVSAAACPHYCTDPDATYGSDRECPPSCALLGGFAIGARVALLRQHNANAKC